MKAEIIIPLGLYDSLVEDSAAFEKIKSNQEFIHFTVWETIGGRRTTIISNDKRVKDIKEASLKELEQIVSYKERQIQKLQDELNELKSRGFFKRLFS